MTCTLLTEPVGGVPEVISTQEKLDAYAHQIASYTGPICVDAERASGFRYSQRAYLLQLKRGDSPIGLIDPGSLDFTSLARVLNDAQWVVHAAAGDLPCLAELGLRPLQLFDSELAARLLGWQGVGLAAVAERVTGLTLAKEHSAADWSTRPLPEAWLRYAALDVELLPQIYAAQVEELKATAKLDLAYEEFETMRLAPPPPPRHEPWRRTSGIHAIHEVRGLAIVRELWLARDELARTVDRAPGRVLPDSAIISAAQTKPATMKQLRALPVFCGRANARRAPLWHGAILRALHLDTSDLPVLRFTKSNALPPPRAWKHKNPQAAMRLTAARELVATISERELIPIENLLSPEVLRQLCWQSPENLASEIAAFLQQAGARRWQVELLAIPLADTLQAAQPAQ